MKYPWESMNEQQKIKACQEEINLPTHNGTTKDDLLNILRWLWDKFEVVPMQKIDDSKEYTAEENELFIIAFDKACEDAADNCCPHEYGLYKCEKCEECPHQGELHQDTQRDIDCWKNYYLQEAEKEQRSESNANIANKKEMV